MNWIAFVVCCFYLWILTENFTARSRSFFKPDKYIFAILYDFLTVSNESKYHLFDLSGVTFWSVKCRCRTPVIICFISEISNPFSGRSENPSLVFGHPKTFFKRQDVIFVSHMFIKSPFLLLEIQMMKPIEKITNALENENSLTIKRELILSLSYDAK